MAIETREKWLLVAAGGLAAWAEATMRDRHHQATAVLRGAEVHAADNRH